jgi:hypothetical protein
MILWKEHKQGMPNYVSTRGNTSIYSLARHDYKSLREEVNLENYFRQIKMPKNNHLLVLLDIGS